MAVLGSKHGLEVMLAVFFRSIVVDTAVSVMKKVVMVRLALVDLGKTGLVVSVAPRGVSLVPAVPTGHSSPVGGSVPRVVHLQHPSFVLRRHVLVEVDGDVFGGSA